MVTIQALPARPGLFLSESTAGSPPDAIATFQRTYFLGTSTIGPYNTPTVLGSTDDFVNTFGSGLAITKNTINVYLQNTLIGLYFVRVPVAFTSTITLGAITTGATATITILGVAFTVTAGATDTAQTLIDSLISSINNNTAINNEIMAHHELTNTGANDYSTSSFIVRSLDGTTFTIAASGIATETAPAQSTVNAWDYIGAANKLSQSIANDPLGFIVCPEAFYTLANQYDRNNVANQMEATARALGWMALIDPGNPTIINNPRLLTAEFAACTAVQGHAAGYYPYCIDTNGNDISPATLTAAFALQRYANEGIQEPAAGTGYPFVGIAGVEFTLSDPQKDFLATTKVNPILFKQGVGYVPYDVQTFAVDTNYRFITTRVILNCIERTIFDTIENNNFIFQSIGGAGVFYLTLRNTIIDILDTFYQAGCLYGLTAADAYACKCDATIQTSDALEAGIVYAQIFAVPAVTVRQISGVVYRVAIGGIANALLQTI